MLKKILSSLATLTLVAGSVTTTTAWIEHKKQNGGSTQKQKPQSSQNYNIKDPNLFAQNNSLPKGDSINSEYIYKNVFYVGTKSGLYESTDNGKTFTKNTSCDYNITTIYAYNDVVYVGTKSNSLWESNDYGVTFTQVYSSLYDKSITTIYAYNHVVYVGTTTFWIYESTDNGKTWKYLASMPSGDPPVNCIYVYNDVIYVGVSGNLFDESDLWESTDNGATFYSVTGTGMSDLSVNCIYVYNDVIYVGTSKGVWISTDKGQSFSQALWFPWGEVSINSIYFYKNAIYVGTNGGLYKADYYQNPDFIQKTSIPVDDSVSSVQTYNNVVYAGTNTGLYELGIIIATVSQPNEILGENTYFAYNQPINFTFDWTLLSQVTIVNNTSTPATKNLTSGSYQIKDDGNYTVTFTSKIGGNKYTNTFFLKTGYHYSHGINGLTFNQGALDSSGNQTYDLDLYINGLTAKQLDKLTSAYTSPFYARDFLGVLTYPLSTAMGSKVWKNSFSNQTLKNSIDSIGNTIDSGLEKAHKLYDTLSGGNPKTKDASILNYGEKTYDKFRTNLHTNIKYKNSIKEEPDNYVGIVLHFEFEDKGSGDWQVNNFDSSDYNDAYNQIVQSQSH